MDEQQWLACANARTMLTFLGRHAKERKLRLFTCACWRRRWAHLADPGSARAVAWAERYADGLCPWADVEAAHEEAQERRLAADRALSGATWGTDRVAFRAAQERQRAAWAAEETAVRGYFYAAEQVLGLAQQGATRRQRAGWADLVRDLFGNPYRPLPPLSPPLLAWNAGLLVKLAQAAYGDRLLPSGELDPARLAVLADALEDAGCASADLLAHLRGPGVHVRGCCCVDLVLGRE